MPLPQVSERAAAQIETVLADLDRRIELHLVTGATLPAASDILDRVEALLRVSITAAVQAINPDAGPAVIEPMVADTMVPLAVAVEDALGRARRQRGQVARRMPDQEDDETVAGFITRVGAVTALVALFTARRRRNQTADLRRIASQVGIINQIPRRTAAYGRMVARTESAIHRNRYAADLAEQRGLVMYVRDALKGPTDEACHRVNGRYATPQWARNHPVEHPNCVAAGQIVSGGSELLAHWTRPFQGQLLTLVTAAGNHVTVTPNHPILTVHGFQPAEHVQPGTEIVTDSGRQRLRMRVPHDVEAPALIEQVRDALIETSSVTTGRVPASPEQFNGDGTIDGNVDVVWTDRFLVCDPPRLVQQISQVQFSAGRLPVDLVASRSSSQVVSRASHPTDGVMGRFGDALSPIRADALHVQPLGVGTGSHDAQASESGSYGATRDGHVRGDHVGRFPAKVTADHLGVDRVARVEVASGQYQVHDLSTSEGWFGCNGIIVSNCTRETRPAVLPPGATVTLLR